MASPETSLCAGPGPAGAKPEVQALAAGAGIDATMRARILFVDDDASVLRLLKLGMRNMAAVWDTDFAPSGEEALVLLEQKKFDVVVTDMRMPGINGAQLLTEVLRRHPQTARVVFSGYSDLNEVLNCVGLTHQFLEKPCSLDQLKGCLIRITQMRARLANDRVSELVTGLKNLPSLPGLYMEIVEAVQSPTATAQRIAAIASKDPAIAAKLLHLSNSGFFGFSEPVFTVEEAVQLLGVGIIQSLAMALPIFSAFSHARCPQFPIQQVWDHSLETGLIAQSIAQSHLQDSRLAEPAFAAGLLHDVGKVILADGLSAAYGAAWQQAAATRTPLIEVERQTFNATHAEIGAYLLALWGLPIPLVEAVANHHCPRRCGTDHLSLAGLVHVANAIQHGAGGASVDADYLKFTGLDAQFAAWRKQFGPKKA